MKGNITTLDMKIVAEHVGKCALSRRAFRCLSLCKRQPAAISPSFANFISPFRLFALASIISPRTLLTAVDIKTPQGARAVPQSSTAKHFSAFVSLCSNRRVRKRFLATHTYIREVAAPAFPA